MNVKIKTFFAKVFSPNVTVTKEKISNVIENTINDLKTKLSKLKTQKNNELQEVF